MTEKDNTDKIINFLGGCLVLGIALSIFFMLMSNEMPQSNRELLIAFVSALFGGIVGSIKKITGEGDGAQQLRDAEMKIKQLEEQLQKTGKETTDETA